MWEARYRDRDRYSPDGVTPHPVVQEEAELLLERAGAEGRTPGQLRAADLGAGAGRHTLALAELGMSVTAVDFAASAHELVRRSAAERGIEGRITPVTVDIAGWVPEPETTFDFIVVAYLHSGLEPLTRAARMLAPGGRLVWIAHAPASPHGPPVERRPSLAAHQDQLAELAGASVSVLRAEEFQLDEQMLDILVVVERAG